MLLESKPDGRSKMENYRSLFGGPFLPLTTGGLIGVRRKSERVDAVAGSIVLLFLLMSYRYCPSGFDRFAGEDYWVWARIVDMERKVDLYEQLRSVESFSWRRSYENVPDNKQHERYYAHIEGNPTSQIQPRDIVGQINT